MNEAKVTSRKRYDEAFKRSAVEHWQSSGKAARQIAVELGVNVQTLKQWKQRLALPPASPAGPRTVEHLEAENRRLRRELEHALRQREVLKKTLGILSAPSGSGWNG